MAKIKALHKFAAVAPATAVPFSLSPLLAYGVSRSILPGLTLGGLGAGLGYFGSEPEHKKRNALRGLLYGGLAGGTIGGVGGMQFYNGARTAMNDLIAGGGDPAKNSNLLKVLEHVSNKSK